MAKKKTAKKPVKAAKKPAPKKVAKKAPTMVPVNSGRGATPAEVGAKLVAMVSSGTPDAQIWDALFDKKFMSIEGAGVNLGWIGRAAVEAKNADWMSKNEVLEASAEGPFAGSSGFAVRYSMKVRDKASGQERSMTEVGVYTVENGKVVREEFMYKH